MFFFQKEEVYIGFSMEEFSKVRGALRNNDIKYTYKVVDCSGQWLGHGGTRGYFGSAGMNSKYEKQYTVFVKKKDSEIAKYLVNKALHS